MNDVRASSWVELQERLFGQAWHEELARHRTSYAFRGRGDASEDLSTSIARLGGDAGAVERHILRAFRKYAANDAVPSDSVWNWRCSRCSRRRTPRWIPGSRRMWSSGIAW